MFAAPSVKYSQSVGSERVKPGGGGVPGSSVEVKSIAGVWVEGINRRVGGW